MKEFLSPAQRELNKINESVVNIMEATKEENDFFDQIETAKEFDGYISDLEHLLSKAKPLLKQVEALDLEAWKIRNASLRISFNRRRFGPWNGT